VSYGDKIVMCESGSPDAWERARASSEVDWERTPASELGKDDRDKLLYRVADQVATLLGPPPGWRITRTGCAINVWIGPDRQRHRAPDFTIWVESNVDQHLHKAIETHVRHSLKAEQ
jgi:hypothetical protein